MRVAVFILTLILTAGVAMADGWKPTLRSHVYGPERIIAVDKSSQQLIMLEQRSPLHEVRRFPCTTGQLEGDKFVEGDLRTPEGVYFVGHKISRTLDWGLYGNIAYSLNYPNPIDRIKGKTGGGIWLHGRGKTFVPRDTLGCVALKVPDMLSVATDAKLGTPVVIASNLAWSPEVSESEGVAADLAKELKKWARDWESRGDSFFSHYNSGLMTRSEGISFDNFIAHKRNIFAAKPWIHVMVENVHAVPGPDYWVTWFDQFYRTEGHTSTTGKRFYWMRDDKGAWRIVGREYTPASEDLESKYLAEKSDEAKALVASWRDAWLSMDLKKYESFYESDAVQGGRHGATSIADYKKSLWAKSAPVRVAVDDLKVSLDPRGLRVAFLQEYENASGYADMGRKTMVLTPYGDGWRIQSEQWSRVQ